MFVEEEYLSGESMTIKGREGTQDAIKGIYEERNAFLLLCKIVARSVIILGSRNESKCSIGYEEGNVQVKCVLVYKEGIPGKVS